MPKLAKKVKKRVARAKSNQPPWKGPQDDGPQGGITQSLLGRYLVCKERFRILTIEGLRPPQQFSHRLEYGQMWHTCEEALAAMPRDVAKAYPKSRSKQADAWGKNVWEVPLKEYCQRLVRRFPTSQQQIEHWYNVCRIQFSVYVDYWRKHPDVKNRTPLLQEQEFKVPYELPSGRVVYLRGKWDSVDLIGKGRNAGVYLQENKTKGDIDEAMLQRQLHFDLQTGLYLVALKEQFPPGTKSLPPGAWDHGVKGVRYNVVRRPLSGGKGSIRQRKPSKSNPMGESADEFYARLANDYVKDDPAYFFMRWKVEFTPQDIARFKHEFLDPCLENLCDDYEWWTFCSRKQINDPFDNNEYERGEVHYHFPRHYRTPFGVYNPLTEGGATDLDEYLATGNKVGLQRVDDLFPELNGAV